VAKPPENGPKPSRYWASDEKPTMVVVRPAKLPRQTMISAVWSAMPYLVAPFAGCLDRCFHRFRAAVHRQRLGHAGHFAQQLQERPQLVAVKRPRDHRQLAGLLAQCRHQGRVAVAETDCGIGRHHVHVTLAVLVPQPDAFAAAEHYRQRFIVVGAVSVFESYCMVLHGRLLVRPLLKT
jgi:hypothetical protein